MLPRACSITLVVSVFLLSCGAYADCDGDACSAERAKEIEEEDAAGSNILLLQTALRFEDDGQVSEKSIVEIIKEAGSTTCAIGYAKVPGDITGPGDIWAPWYSEVVGGCMICAQMCSDRPYCMSYECSHTELECNLNTIRHPTSPDDYKDFDFCMKDICTSGYEEEVGDVGGWGSINVHGNGESVASCQQCAGFCDSFPACLSYECSLEELKCNLNELREPTISENFRTYGFCKKSANWIATTSITTVTTTTTWRRRRR